MIPTTYLLDVNVLVGLFDPAHVAHDAAHGWLAVAPRALATNAFTEAGFVRVIAAETYRGTRTSIRGAVDCLAQIRATPSYRFLPCVESLTDGSLIELKHVQGSRQLTDILLLGAAVVHGCRLVTFDRAIPVKAVRGGIAALELLGTSDPS